MNATARNILTNPFFIGSSILGVSGVTAAIVYAKNRPKTPEELSYKTMLEQNAEAERKRQHELAMAKIQADKELEEAKEKERTERAKNENEHELTKIREKRAWEKEAPKEWWEREIAQINATAANKASEREFQSRKELAKIQADGQKAAAEAQAQAIKDSKYYDYLKHDSQFSAQSSMVSSIADGLANMVNKG